MDEQVQLLQQERAALEAELEVVRNRAAELAETAADERRRGAEERAEWSGELKQLRRALEKQAQLLLRYQELASSAPAMLSRRPGLGPPAARPRTLRSPATRCSIRSWRSSRCCKRISSSGAAIIIKPAGRKSRSKLPHLHP